MGESFPPAVVAKLNETWLPDQAGTGCLWLLNCVNGITLHWMTLTDEEREQSDAWDEPKPDRFRACRLAIGKLEWLRVRLPVLLKRLGQPDELVEFLDSICVMDGVTLTDASAEPLPQYAEEVNSLLTGGLEELKWKLLRFGQKHELPVGWDATRWCNYEIGIQPVRTITELIYHLRRRAVSVRQMGQTREGKRFLHEEMLNARLGVRSLISDPGKRPKCEKYDPNDFKQSQIELEKLIDDLCEREAMDAKGAEAVGAGVPPDRQPVQAVNHRESITEAVSQALRKLDDPNKRDRSILKSMYELKATPEGSRVKAESIARKAIDSRAGAESIKALMVMLKRMGLVESRKGPSGGSKLTALGLAVAMELKRG